MEAKSSLHGAKQSYRYIVGEPDPTLLPASLLLCQAAHICTTDFTGADPSCPVGMAGMQCGVNIPLL